METVKVNHEEFRKAILNYIAMTDKSVHEVILQKTYNIAGRAFDILPPKSGSYQEQRNKIKAYLKEQLAQKIKFTKTGKNPGKSFPIGRKSSQLKRVNLIINKRRGKMNLPGLYGEAMKRREQTFTTGKQVGVGSLKIAIWPIWKALYPLPEVKYKKWPTFKGIARIPDGVWTRTILRYNKNSYNPNIRISFSYNFRGNRVLQAENLITNAWDLAISGETREIIEYLKNKLSGNVRIARQITTSV